ncbi:MAG: hypothetical protein IJY35_12130 [Clostridia bacterium]|nr:hypothetical protein [Clostridia bacterium]
MFQEIWRERSPNSNQIIHLNGGHLTLDWETIVKDGITEYIRRAEERLLTADEGDERVFVEGMLEVYKSVRTYIARYADAAEKAVRPTVPESDRTRARNLP